MAADLDRVEAAHHNASLDLAALAGEYLGVGSNRPPEKQPARQSELPALAFVIHMVLSAVLQAMEPSLKTRIRDGDWRRGYCPICGSLPSISYLSKAQPLGSEFLVGGGGQRYLHCVLCGHDWQVQRNLCAVCEREATDEKMYFSVPDEPGERIDVCQHCGHYLPCIDLRETGLLPHLDTACVGMAHLDLLAQEKGFTPMVPMPWNTFE